MGNSQKKQEIEISSPLGMVSSYVETFLLLAGLFIVGLRKIQKKIPALIVNSSYEVTNGLVGMMRNVLLRLFAIISNRIGITREMRNQSLKAIVGISQEQMALRKHQYFVEIRTFADSAIQLRPNHGCTIRDTPWGPCCTFTIVTNEYGTVFVNNAISKGVFRWTIINTYSKTSAYFLGSAPPDLLSAFDYDYLGVIKRTSSFSFWNGTDVLKSGLFGVSGSEDFDRTAFPVPDKSCVSIEIDCAARTLAFFVNDAKVPHAISGVCVPAHFGVTGFTRSAPGFSFTSVSFRRLPRATQSAVVCKMYNMRV